MKTQIKEQVDKLLSSAKMKRTIPRSTILEVLLSAKRLQTVDEIMAAIGKGSANKVTVYRTLESLCRAGLVHRAFVHKRAEHFELADRCTDAQCHPHFTCRKCGATRCLVGVSVPLVKGLGRGFILQRQQVRLEGICPACA